VRWLTDINATVLKGNTLLKKNIGAISGTLGYEETAYHLPVTYALTGKDVHDATGAREAYILTGENALVGAEILEAYQVASKGREPDPYTGFIGDATIRKLGYSLVDGSILGLALVVGTPPSSGMAAGICRELQEKYMLTFLAGHPGAQRGRGQSRSRLPAYSARVDPDQGGPFCRHPRPGSDDVWRGAAG
jgi:acetyl-CoA decarbonylase/synthase complex subunit beta